MDNLRVIKIGAENTGLEGIIAEDKNNEYEGIRYLWCRVFGDDPEFVDFFYRSFGRDIAGYAICSDEGKTVSAVTCFRCGIFRDPEGGSADGMPVYVTYAVCTDPEYRGHGYAAVLTDYVREVVTAPRGAVLHEDDDEFPAAEGLGGISLVSPAEESLIGYYAGLGYMESFFVDEHIVRAGEEALPEEDWRAAETANVEVPAAADSERFAGTADNERFAANADTRFWGLGPDGKADFLDEEDGEAFEPELSVESVGGAMYNRYREEFLAGIPHVEMSSEMMEFLSADGEGGLLVINGGDAVCRVAYAGDAGDAGTGRNAGGAAAGKTVMLDELLVNPQLLAFSEEIGEEIALQLAEYFGAESLVYRTPGGGRCQSMTDSGAAEVAGYFGFPVE